MDYAKPPKYYDTFALRDAEGEEAVMQTWPYFRSKTSRKAIKSNRPVPVASCWNGMGKLPALPSLEALSISSSKARQLKHGSTLLNRQMASLPVSTKNLSRYSAYTYSHFVASILRMNSNASSLVSFHERHFFLQQDLGHPIPRYTR